MRTRLWTALAAVLSMTTALVVVASAASAAPITMSVVTDSSWIVDDGPATAQAVTCESPWGISFGPAQWIWDRPCPQTGQVQGERHRFSRTFDVPGAVISARLSYTIDNHGSADINGHPAGVIPDWFFPVTDLDVTPSVQPGSNTITIDATDEGGIAALIANLTITYEPKAQPPPGGAKQPATFSGPVPFQGAGLSDWSCLYMQDEVIGKGSKGTQTWHVRYTGAVETELVATVEAVSVNPAESGTLNASFSTGSAVDIDWPTGPGVGPGDANSDTIATTVSPSDSLVDLTFARRDPAEGPAAHHYRVSFNAPVEVGLDTPTVNWHEHERQLYWLNLGDASGGTTSAPIAIFLNPGLIGGGGPADETPDGHAVLRGPGGFLVDEPDADNDGAITISVPNGSPAGRYELEVDVNHHYNLSMKSPGPDYGVYLRGCPLHNQPPIVPPQAVRNVNEGSPVTLTVTGATDPDGDTLSYAWDLDGLPGYEVVGPSVIITPDDGHPLANIAVPVEVNDGEGGVVNTVVPVHVNNVAPVGTLNAPGVVDVGTNFAISLTGVTDPSNADTIEGFTYSFGCPPAGPSAFGPSDTRGCTAPMALVTITVGGAVRDKDDGVTSYQRQVQVVDRVRPTGACLPTTNPSGNNVPTAGVGAGRSGMNPDGFYQLTGKDNFQLASIVVRDSGSSFVSQPFTSGSKIKLVQAPGKTPSERRPGPGVIDAQLQLRGDAILVVTDTSGNVFTQNCLVPPLPK